MIPIITEDMAFEEFLKLGLKPGDIAIDKDVSFGDGIDAQVKMIELNDHEKCPELDYYGGSCLYAPDNSILVIGYCCAGNDKLLIHQRAASYSPRTKILPKFPELVVLDVGSNKEMTLRMVNGPLYEAQQESRRKAAMEIRRYDELKEFLKK